MRFVKFWIQQTRAPPQELVFHSQLSTCANQRELDRQQIHFLARVAGIWAGIVSQAD